MTINRTAVRLLVAVAVTGLGLATAGCQRGGKSAAPPATVTNGSELPAPASRFPAGWPDTNFPLPPSVTVTQGQDAGGTGIVLTGVEPGKVAEFYRDALPAAGYQITKDNSVSIGGVGVVGMEFTGHGYQGQLAVLDAGANAVAISLDG